MIICVPGSWLDRNELIKAVISSTQGKFMFAGGILANPENKDHVELTFEERAPSMMEAFRYAGQGKISDVVLEQIETHHSVAYLHFPLRYLAQRDRLRRFTDVLANCGGIAIKNESSGIAHEWGRWFELLESDELFDAYSACVVLVGENGAFYSCGMHHFGLPETQVSLPDPSDAATLINNFNFFQLCDEPKLESGHTFSIAPDSPKYRLLHRPDERHPTDDLFHNPRGVWNLEYVEQGVDPNA